MKKISTILTFLLIITACQTITEEPVADEDTTIEVLEEVTDRGWTTYQDEELDIIFDYPAEWELSETEYTDKFFTRGGEVMIFGITFEHIYNDRPLSNVEQCAIRHIDGDWSCENGCEEIIDGVFITQSSSRNGDAGYEMYATTNLSENYPSICFQLNLGSILYEIAEANDIEYWQVSGEYNIESMIENGEISNEILEQIDTFKEVVKTIRKK